MFLGTRKVRFWQRRWKTLNNWPKVFSSQTENDEKISIFQEKRFSILFSWTHRVQFRKLRIKLNGKSLKIFISNTENDERTTILSKVFILFKMVLGHVKFSFDIPYIFLPAGSGKFFTQCPQKMRKFLLFVRKVSLFGRFLWKHRKQFWRPCRYFFDKKLLFYCAMYEQFSKNEQSSKWKVLLEMILWTRRFQFRQTFWFFIGN